MEVHPGNDPARRGSANARRFKKGEALNAVNEKKFSALMHLGSHGAERFALVAVKARG